MLKRMGSFMLCLALTAASTACAGGSREEPRVDRDTLTQRQKDSITAESVLPGAGVVREALELSDTMAARAARMDSLMSQ